MSKIAASILAANTMHLGDSVQKVLDTGCDAIHFDVMDGVFVPNISFGPGLLHDLKKEFQAYLDVHLMLHNPLQYIDVFAESGADAITVHVESDNYQQSIQQIRKRGLRVGASLKPATPATILKTLGRYPRSNTGHDGGTGLWRTNPERRYGAKDCGHPVARLSGIDRGGRRREPEQREALGGRRRGYSGAWNGIF